MRVGWTWDQLQAPVTHRCSCCGTSQAESRRGTRRCIRHACSHTPRAGSARQSRTHPHLRGKGWFQWRQGQAPSQPRPKLLPRLPQLTFAGPINPFKASWTRSIWDAHLVGVTCRERRELGRGARSEMEWAGSKMGWEELKGVGCGLSAWSALGWRSAWVGLWHKGRVRTG